MVATYAWISGGEIPSQRLRSYTFGLAAALGFLAAWLATFTAPYFINPESLNWGPKYGYIWTPCCWLGALWVFFFLPEVKGRTLEEIDEMVSPPKCRTFFCSVAYKPQFEARVPARKFRKYQCIGRTRQDITTNSVSSEKKDDVERIEEVVWTDSKAATEATIAKA
jgi:MFS transporter, SP family, sugar:H+ symporter